MSFVYDGVDSSKVIASFFLKMYSITKYFLKISQNWKLQLLELFNKKKPTFRD